MTLFELKAPGLFPEKVAAINRTNPVNILNRNHGILMQKTKKLP